MRDFARALRKNRDQCEAHIAAKKATATCEIRGQYCKTYGFEGAAL